MSWKLRDQQEIKLSNFKDLQCFLTFLDLIYISALTIVADMIVGNLTCRLVSKIRPPKYNQRQILYWLISTRIRFV